MVPEILTLETFSAPGPLLPSGNLPWKHNLLKKIKFVSSNGIELLTTIL